MNAQVSTLLVEGGNNSRPSLTRSAQRQTQSSGLPRGHTSLQDPEWQPWGWSSQFFSIPEHSASHCI